MATTVSPLTIVRVEPWAPHPAVAPIAVLDGDCVTLAGNGTRACAGGMQVVYAGVRPGARYRVRLRVSHTGVTVPRDMLRATAYWAEQPRHDGAEMVSREALLPRHVGPSTLELERDMPAPEGATHLTVRYVFRWSPTGESHWTLPEIEELEPLAPRPPVRVAVVTGLPHQRQGIKTVADNVDFYLRLCQDAARERPGLMVLPEVCLQWGLPGHAVETAVDPEGPEVQPFRDLAREHALRLCLGIFERNGDAVHNTALLISPQGEVDGRYRKVHLATDAEENSGILPGDDFAVYETEIGRVGCNICMDSSCAESSRMVGLNGAEWLLLPIMGDHRASRWTPGYHHFNEGRWFAIQRAHAIDNQLRLVIARNVGWASCIIDRKGEVLAWNEGELDYIVADVPRDDGYRMYQGSRFEDVNWLQRRPSVYGAMVDPDNVGSLR